MDSVGTPRRDELRARLEAEHEQRKAEFVQKRARGKDRAKSRQERKEQDKQRKLEQAERIRFYKEKGYKKYVDSRGRLHWLLPEEYAWREKARKAREARNKRYGSPAAVRNTEIWLMGLAALLAVALGLFLIR